MCLRKYNNVSFNTKLFWQLVLLIGITILLMEPAYAGQVDIMQQYLQGISGGNISGAAPWEEPLLGIQRSLTGNTAKISGAIAIAITGLGVAFGIGGDLVQKAMRVCFGLSIVFNGLSWIGPMVGLTKGALL